nr:YfkD famly protein [Pullulanibacillus pueri]
MKKILIACLMTSLISVPALAKENPEPKKENKQHQEEKDHSSKKQAKSNDDQMIKKPDSVVDIAQKNTYPNPNQNEPQLQPSAMTKELFNTSKVEIENPTLIRLLNESSIHTSKLSLGYRARIYLGNWALNYQSSKTTVNWEYKKVNENLLDNRGGKQMQNLSYNQERQLKVSGGLTAQVPNQKEVKKLMMLEAAEKTNLPLAFETYVGVGTKIDRVYHVETKKVGHLSGYVPAVNEKGKVTYGEVYLVLNGGHKSIEVKNVTHQGIGAWIPIQDYVSLRYFVSN